MKAILLALALGLTTAAGMTGVLRVAPRNARLLSLVALFVMGVAGLIAVHIATPQNLWILPPHLIATRHGCSLLFAVFLYFSGFWGGLLQLYNLADRGLSLRILIDVLEAPSRALSAADIAKGYGAGRGLNWMYAKRLGGMAAVGLIERHGADIVITAKGMGLAKMFAGARMLLGLSSPLAARKG